MRKIVLLFVLCVGCLYQLSAQEKIISGKVTDEKGGPVSFATVQVEGTRTTTVADANGAFEIKANPGAKLVVSSSGFAKKTVAVSDAATIMLATTDKSQLSEVIVTALGIRRPAKSIGYATAKVTASELTQARAVNMQQGLVGKVSGLNITTVNSGVFENTKINLRGLRSLTGNNQPLLVIDGIPTPIVYMSSLNPNDITEVSILKGASSAAIYGPDGVNGVILITTRKGTSGKPVITVSSSYQLSRVAFMPKRQHQFGSGSSLDATGQALYDPLENFSYGPSFDGSMVPIGRELEDGSIQMVPYRYVGDEQKKFWNGNGSVLQNDVSFATQDYYISIQDAKINGVMPKDENRRTSFRFNASKTYNRFQSSFNVNYIQSNFNVVDEAAIAGRIPAYTGGIYNLILQTAGHIPLSKYKDWRNDKFSQFSNYFNEYAVNPYWSIDNHRLAGKTDDLLASMEFKFEIARWLNATARVGTNFTNLTSKSSRYEIVVSEYAASHRSPTTFTNRPGSVRDESNRESTVTGEFFLSGKKDFQNFGISYLAGSQFRQNQAKFMNATGNNLVVPNLFTLANRTGEAITNEENFKSRLGSVFASIGFNYKGWANIEFVGRNDWDSRLNPDANSYFYPGVNAAIVLTDAFPALRKGDLLSHAKIRGSVSKSGNVNLRPYQLYSSYSPIGGFPYGSLAGFSANDILLDKSIKPEFVNSKEFGIELGFLKNKINLDATYFFQNNTDQILLVQQSTSTGYTQKLANTADFDNYGVELDLKLTPLINAGNFKIDVRMNATYNNSKITRLADGIDELSIGGSRDFIQLKADAPEISNFAIVGHPAFTFKFSDYKRDEKGRIIVDPVTGNPGIDDSLVTRGRTMPLWVLGFNPSFSWKGITLGMTWDYKGGHHAYHGLGNDMDGYGISKRSAYYNRERFVIPNSVYWDGSKYVENKDRTVSNGGIEFWGNKAYNTSIASNYFTSAAALKLRELLISYELPTGILERTKVIKKAVISAIARNLFVFVPRSNHWSDPEFNATPRNNNPNTFGISSSFSTPPTRIFGGSLTLTF